jgi:hypothetical protein
VLRETSVEEELWLIAHNGRRAFDAPYLLNRHSPLLLRYVALDDVGHAKREERAFASVSAS